MALEKTVLNDDIVSDLLSRYYGITPIFMQKTELGTANCFRIYDGIHDYFLKEFQSAISESNVIREAKLLEFLSASGIPTANFYKTKNQEFLIRYQNHVICLEKYIDGKTYGYDDLPLHLLPKVGEMLGKLHHSLRNYLLPIDMSERWLSSFSASNMMAQYDSLIEIAKNKANNDKMRRMITDLEYKKGLAIRCENYKKYYEDITYCSTHGDYQSCQLIFEKDEIKAIVDFSSAACLPVTWEVMRSFVQSSAVCRKEAVIDIFDFCEYVRSYMRYFPLTKKDIIAMPYVYLFQLARSKYGYTQYLNSDSEDKEGLLQFAFWRTQMCREAEKKADAISEELLKLFESERI